MDKNEIKGFELIVLWSVANAPNQVFSNTIYPLIDDLIHRLEYACV